MAIASWLTQTFLALRRLLQLLKSFRGLIPLVLRRILERLAFIWSILRTKLGFRRRGIGKPPSSSQDDESRITKARKERTRSKHTEQAETSRLESGSTSCTLIEQGEIISLGDVAFSAYPFPGNIRATRSTRSLANSHRSAPNLGEVDSLRIPSTRFATPVFILLDEPRISPRMPEDLSGRRYGERPRM
jgi:hypothetical protein